MMAIVLAAQRGSAIAGGPGAPLWPKCRPPELDVAARCPATTPASQLAARGAGARIEAWVNKMGPSASA